MTQDQHSPHGYPQEPITGSTPTDGKAAKAAAQATHPWYKKKRAIIPAGILALFIAIGVAGGGGDDTDPTAATSSPSATEDVQLAEATVSAEDEAAQQARAAEEAAAEAEAEAERGTLSRQNALRAAENYLDYTSFSHQGLVDQLVFEGFTAEQAQYGVSQTGL